MDVLGIIVRSADYGEKDKLLTIATVDGLKTVKARGVRSAKSKLKGYVGILNFGEFGLSEGKSFYILNSANISESFLNCWTSPVRYASAMICLEIYEKCAKEGDGPGLVLLLNALKEINYDEFYPPAAALRFGVAAAAEMGVDVTENVFPEQISGIFTSLLGEAETEEILRDVSENEIKLCLRHLAAGFRSELGIQLTVPAEIFSVEE